MSDHWKTQPRKPKGSPEGGEWTDDPGLGYPSWKHPISKDIDAFVDEHPYPGWEEDREAGLVPDADAVGEAARKAAGLPSGDGFPREYEYPHPDWIADREDHYKYQLTNDDYHGSVSEEEAEMMIDEALYNIENRIERGEFRINAPPEAANKIVEEGRFKSQFETNTSKGSLSLEDRSMAERRAFGYSENIEPVKRPVYGYVHDFEDIPYQNANYGLIAFGLKNEVRKRTTVTWDDSLFGMGAGNQTGAPPDSLHVGAFNEHWDIQEASVGSAPHYLEAQYHGGLTLSDVSRVYIHSWAFKPNRQFGGWDVRDFTAELDRIGIPWEKVGEDD